MTILVTKKQSHIKGGCDSVRVLEYTIILRRNLIISRSGEFYKLEKNHTKRVKIVDNTRTVWYYNIKNRTTST